MKNILRALAVFSIAARRLLAQRGLALATLLGLVVVISLTMSIPLYAEGVYYRVLSEGLFSDTPRFRGQALRPPVAMLFRYIGSFSGPLQWENIGPLDNYFQAQVYRDLRLPSSPDAHSVRMFNTGLFGLFTEADADVVTDKTAEYQVALACIGKPEQHLTLVDGRFPADDSTFEVLVSRFVAEKMGIQAGETYIAYDLRAMRQYKDNPAKFEMRVAGVWEPADPDAEFWEYSQVPLDNLFFVPEATFTTHISDALNNEVYQALWYLPMDAEEIFVSDVDPLLRRIETLKRDVLQLLPNTTPDISPEKVLQRYQEAANLLTLQLYVFSLPIISLLIAFIALIVALTVDRQRNQIAALRSRGATISQVSGITALESVLLGGLALVIALPVSLGLAYVVGQVRSFLDFSLATDMRVGLTWATVRLGLVAMVLTLGAQILPTLGAARHTIITYKQEQARTLRPPWWQRAWLDVLLLIPVGYGGYVLRQQGNILENSEATTTSLFRDPLLFLVPALSLFALTLFALRLLPLLMRLFAWLGKRTRSVGFLTAARHLSRSPRLYMAPLSLLILTLSLSTYTASLAATLDTHLYDQQYYWVGADASLVDTGEKPSSGTSDDTSAAGQSAAGSGSQAIPWRFLPVTEYEKLPDVQEAVRVGRYEGRVQTTQGFQPGAFIGVDRADYANVAFWREDFASASLGALMNQLAITPEGILLPQPFMREHIINVGDTVNVTVIAYEQATSMQVKVVGSFDYFPTWYPDTGPLIVGNLQYFFQEAQSQFPYRVWMQTATDTDYTELADAAWNINLGAQALQAASQRIQREQGKPERQGLLGLLSVGFSAAAVLTALGFMLYALFSFRRRAVEMGVLRAAGLSRQAMAAIVAWELLFLLLIGGAAGTGLGVWASQLFIPYLQFGTDATAYVPPFHVEIAWPALFRLYALFAMLFLVALALLVRQLVRMKLFEAIKLGETL